MIALTQRLVERDEQIMALQVVLFFSNYNWHESNKSIGRAGCL